MGNRKKLLQFLRPDPAVAAAKSPSISSSSCSDDEDNDDALSPLPSPMATPSSTQTSATASPYAASPWINLPGLRAGAGDNTPDLKTTTGLLGSLVKPDGHVYSLAASGDLLYTGTDSKNVRVWRDHRESSAAGFRCGSGLVKAIVVSPSDGRIFTGHQDGKIRVWLPNSSSDNNNNSFIQHKRVGSLPRLGDYLRSSVMPSRYVETGRRRKSCVWLRHFDAVSCLSLDAAAGVLYSGSWDRSFKAWRVSDSRCLESMVHAHDDAVNAVAVAGFDALVFTGSADGSVKVWRREHLEEVARKKKKKKGGKTTRHVMERVLRKGDSAVNGIAVCVEARVVYVGSSDGAVTHWQWRRGGDGGAPPRNGGVLRGHGNMAVLCVAVAGGRVVASGGADRTVCVWRRDEGAQHSKIAVLKGHTGPVKCVAMDLELEDEDRGHGDGDGYRRWVVYSGSLDGSVKVWRVSDAPDASTTPTPARAWNGSPSPPLAGAWTPSSRLRG